MSDNLGARDVPSPGSREPSPTVSALTGFDPSRIEVGGVRYVREDAFLFLQEWLWTELKDSRDQTDQAALRAKWDLEKAVKLGLNSHLPTLDEVRAAWRDSDGSGEAGEAGTGSTEGDSAGPKDIAQDPARNHLIATDKGGGERGE